MAKPEHCFFQVTAATPVTLAVTAPDGKVYRANIATSVLDVRFTGVDDKGEPKFDFDVNWNARWYPVEDGAPLIPPKSGSS